MKKIFIFVLLFFLPINASAQSLENITWLTEEYAPYNYTENGVVKGIAVDILVAVWKKINLNKTAADIKVYPWARGYKMVQEDPGVCLFSMTVTEPRKELFKFVGPLAGSDITIIAPKAKGLKIGSIDDLKKPGLKLGAVREDVGEQLLIAAGIAAVAIDQSNNAETLVKKLDAGRMDAVAYGFDTARYNMKLLGIDSNRYETVFMLKQGEMGFAFHKNVDPAVITTMQKALDELIADGTTAAIIKKYLQ